MKSNLFLALSVFLLSACGNGYYWGPSNNNNPTGGVGVHDMQATGLVRYSTRSLADATEMTAIGSSILRVTFKMPGKALPKNVAVEYFTPNQYQYSEAIVRPLSCEKTYENLAAGQREFTCKLLRKQDDYDHRTFYLQSFRFELDGAKGSFGFEQVCANYSYCHLRDSHSVTFHTKVVPTLEPAEPNT